MLRALYREWSVDVDQPEYVEQRDFLESVLRMELVPIGHAGRVKGQVNG
jgi:hypothetical protein